MRNRNTIFRKKDTFADYCDRWMAANRNCLKVSSQVKYNFDLENHIKPFFGACRPSAITSGMVDSFTQMLLHEKKLSTKTSLSILTVPS